MSREEIISQNPIADFVRDRGHELKQAGENFVTSGCPVKQHKRGHRPVMIYPETQSWSCHDCKLGGSIIDWLIREKNITAADALRELGGGRNHSEPLGEIVATYDYVAENGALLFQCVRYEPKGFSQRQPNGNGGFVWNLKGVARVLYRLPEVLKAQSVCVCEGEKDADNLSELGFTATTNPMGAGKWRDEYSETLRGKDVIVFGDVGDDDGAGEKHTQQVIDSLVGKAKSIKHVALPDGFHDVSDFIRSMLPKQAKQAIEKLIEVAPEIETQKSVDVDEPEIELPPPAPAPYIPPPLDLLPVVLRDYVETSASCLDVDESFVFLPLLASLGAAIGNSRSMLLKRDFVQPPVIWTAIIGRSGCKKSPSIDAGCLASMEHEHELRRQNKEVNQRYDDEVADWESGSKKLRGRKPEKPVLRVHVTDDLTIETLADLHAANPRGLLVRKDEVSHWFASFDQYKSGKGSDVARWLSLHTTVFFAVDRRSDYRHYRIFDPRVCITGGIQPAVLERVLTPDFFERGLPARFLFAHPPFRQDKWSDATIPVRIKLDALGLFDSLWLLAPRQDNGRVAPALLTLDQEAKAAFVAFYNATGRAVLVCDDREGAWSKLTGYAARLALIGQLAHDPDATTIRGEVMQAAVKLAEWFGHEAERIYSELSETDEQRQERRLIECIRRHGGTVTARDVMRSMHSDKEQTDRALNALVKKGFAERVEIKPEGRGRPTVEFRLIRQVTVTQLGNSPMKTGNCVTVTEPNSEKITATPEVGIVAI